MTQQTWIITFNDISLSEANQYASQLKEALQGTPHNVIVSQQSSIPHAQNLGDTILATIKDPSAIVAVAYVVIVFIKSRLINVTIKVKDTEIQAKNLNSRNVEKTIENLVKQANELRSMEK